MWLGHVIRAALLLFLAVNCYAAALRFLPVPPTLLMAQRSQSGEEVRRDWRRLEEISPFMVEAVMAGEDSRFCAHEGIDWAAIEQAIEDNQEGGRRRGGSTITQQTAKNVFFWNGGGYIRKAGEAWFASLIDFTWGKPRVMEVYLNVAEWGDGIFGVEAAAQNRFGKSAKDLSQQDAALLAAVLPSPNKWRLYPPTDFVRRRAGVLQKRMAVIRNSGYASCVISTEVFETAQPIGPPREHVPKAEKPTPGQKELTLEEVLTSAEESLDKKENDMSATPPLEIPPVNPATIPSMPNEIAPDITPEAPREIPQEIPVESPPAEIPQRIDTPRAAPETPRAD